MPLSLLILCISSLLSASPHPFLEPPPVLPLPEQSPELPPSPTSPVAAPVGQQQQNPALPATPGLAAASPVAAPAGGMSQQASGGLEQDQQQPLDGSDNGGSDEEQEPEQGNLQPTSAGAGVQPIGFGQAGQQQAVGFGAQPLVDNTPFDSGSSRMACSWSWFGYVAALAWTVA